MRNTTFPRPVSVPDLLIKLIRHLTTVAFVFVVASLFLIGGCGKPFESRAIQMLDSSLCGTSIYIDNRVGDVTFIADAGAQDVRAEITKIGRGSTKAEADAALAAINPEFKRDESRNRLLASPGHPKDSPMRSYCVEWKITAPPDQIILVRNNVGDVAVRGFTRQVEVTSSVGDVTVEGDEAAWQENGPVKIVANVGDVRAFHIGKGLNVRSEVGDVHAQAGGVVQVATDVGDATVKLLDVDNTGGKVTTDVGDAVVELPRDWKGKMDLRTHVGDLSVDLANCSVRKLSHNGRHLLGEVGDSDKASFEGSTNVGDLRVVAY